MNLVFMLFSKKDCERRRISVSDNVLLSERKKTKCIVKKKKIFEGFQPVNITVWEWKVNEPFKTVICFGSLLLPLCQGVPYLYLWHFVTCHISTRNCITSVFSIVIVA